MIGGYSSEKEYTEHLKNKFKYNRLDLNDRELLILLLSYVGSVRSPIKTADALLERFVTFQACIHAEYDELCSVDGISNDTASLFTIMQRMNGISSCDSLVGSNFSEIGSSLRAETEYARNEQLFIVALDRLDTVVGIKKCGISTPDSISFRIADAVDLAARVRAAKLAVVHTHPTLDSPDASVTDLNALNTLGDVLKERGLTFVGITVMSGGKQKLYRYKA